MILWGELAFGEILHRKRRGWWIHVDMICLMREAKSKIKRKDVKSSCDMNIPHVRDSSLNRMQRPDSSQQSPLFPRPISSPETGSDLARILCKTRSNPTAPSLPKSRSPHRSHTHLMIPLRRPTTTIPSTLPPPPSPSPPTTTAPPRGSRTFPISVPLDIHPVIAHYRSNHTALSVYGSYD